MKVNSIFVILLSLFIILISTTLGVEKFTWAKFISDPRFQNIYFEIRIPRIFSAFFIGAVLSLCGSVYQALFNNPLASPYTLGVSSGTSLAHVCFLMIPAFQNTLSFFGLNSFVWSGFLGGMFTYLLIIVISKWSKSLNSEILLLAGVALNFVFSGLIMFIQYLVNLNVGFKIIRWMMGSLDIYGHGQLITLAFVGIIGFLLIFILATELDLLALGEEFAISRGVNIKKVKNKLLIITALLVSYAVSLTGPIGFVGMMIPHMVRTFFGNNHRFLVLNTFFMGGTFLVICDTLSRIIIAPAEIPVGIITSLLGGPFFLYLLFKKINYQ